MRKLKTIVVPTCHSKSVIRSLESFFEDESILVILIGDVNKTKEIALEFNIQLSNSQLINEVKEDEACNIAAKMANDGRADIVMKGIVHTSLFLKSLLSNTLDLKEKGRIISLVSRFILEDYHKPLYLSDAGINIAPNIEEKIEIIRNSIEIARAQGVKEPRVSILSPVEVVNPKIKSTVEASEISKIRFKNALVDGPLSFDLSISKKAVEIKKAQGQVPGNADILIAPNLDVGNVLYKSLAIFGKAKIASVVSGLRVPVVLTSRADSIDVKIESINLALSIVS